MTDKHTRKDALQELLAKVGAGGKIQPFLFQDAFNNQNHVNCAGEAYDAYIGSLDAALDLHEAVLHERVVAEWKWSKRYGGVFVLLIDGNCIGEGASIDNPARAWLCAILKALIAECDE